jgi:hypothetical protein
MEDLFGGMNLDVQIDTEEIEKQAPAASEDAAGNPNAEGEKPEVNLEVKSTLEEDLLDVDTAEIETNSEEVNEDGTLKETDKSTPPSTAEDNNSSSSPEQPFVELSKKMFEGGYLTQFEEEDFKKALEENDGDPLAAFGEVIKKTVEDVHQDWIAQYPPEVQDVIKASQAGIPLDKMIQLKQEQLVLSGITEDKIKEDADLRKELLINHRKVTTKLSEKQISKDVQRIIDAGEDEDDAIEAYKDLVKINTDNEKLLKEETIRQKQLADKQRTEKIEGIKKDIYSTKEIIPSIPLVKKEQDELAKSMTTIVYTDEQGRGYTDVDKFFSEHPIEARKALHYYYQKGLFKVDEKTGVFAPDFSKITNTLKTVVTKEMKSNAEKSRQFKSGTPEGLGSGDKVDIGASLNSWLNKK